jgi:xanthine dehydrogenase accessory factor
MNTAKRHGDPEAISEEISRVLDEGATAVLATLIEAGHSDETLPVGAKLLVAESGDRVSSVGDPELDEAVARHAAVFLSSREETKAIKVEDFATGLERFHGALVLFERVEAEPRLIICGAGHVGASLARLAALVGYRATLVDDRRDFVRPESFPESGVELVLADDWQDAVRSAIGPGRGVSVAIVTRGHKQDEECLRAVVSASPDYVGMIGSKRRTNIVLEKLREEGVAEDKLRNVRAPIGLNIAAVSPEEVALAILAEIVAERRGGSGKPLSEWRRS